jgi:hypothetical protein
MYHQDLQVIEGAFFAGLFITRHARSYIFEMRF